MAASQTPLGSDYVIATQDIMKHANKIEFSSFEKFLLFDHRNQYPMNFYIQIELEEDIDKPQFFAALAWLSRQHPRLRARTRKGLMSCHCEIQDELPLVAWMDKESPTDREIILSKFWSQSQRYPGHGVRFLVDKNCNSELPSCKILMEVFHPLFEGLFCMRILGELIGYLHIGEQLTPIIIERPRREQRPLKPAVKQTISIKKYLQVILKYLTYSPAPLWPSLKRASSRNGTAGDVSKPWQALNPSHRVILSEAETCKLNEAAQQAGANLNAALVSCIFSTIAKLSTSTGQHKKKLRIAVPISTLSRTSRISAQNKIGYVFLDRHSQDCFDTIKLSQWIADSLQIKKARTEAESYLSIFDFLDKLKWPLWLFSQLPLCHATAVVSNGGSLERWISEGTDKTKSNKMAATVKNFYGVPPIRPRTQMSAGISKIMDTIAISMLFDEAAAINFRPIQFVKLLENEINLYSSHSFYE